MLKVKDFIRSCEQSLKHWKEGLEEINNGTFKGYDRSMPNSCVDAMYESKVKTVTDTLNFLKSLNPEKIIQTNKGLTKEGATYYRLVNL